MTEGGVQEMCVFSSNVNTGDPTRWYGAVDDILLSSRQIAATGSSSHATRSPVRIVDNSGMTSDLHDTNALNMWLSGSLVAF